MPYVDTHCHLEEVLQAVAGSQDVPSLEKAFDDLTAEERVHWVTLGWMFPTSAEEVNAAKAAGRLPGPDENGRGESCDDDVIMTPTLPEDVEGGADDGAGCGISPTKKRKRSIWGMRWEELTPPQQNAAEELGWTARTWNVNKWLLPKKTPWKSLGSEVQQSLSVLGEDPESWDTWNGITETSRVGLIATPTQSYTAFSKENRSWWQLSAREQAAALGLGFTEKTWDNQVIADVSTTIDSMFGASFQACITQGCDVVSIEHAEKLCLSHPQVFASFGCHPKGVYTYDDKLEARILKAMETCGHKALAWGEFGLDFSHPNYGKVADNRRLQKEVFTRQLKLAIKHGYALVLHSRGADRDTLRLLRQHVPRDWKVHMHSYRGSIQTLEAMLTSWTHMYVGYSGLLTMGDEEVEELCRRTPLDRLLLETDAPYLPLNGTNYSHCGQIPSIAARVAELKGCSVEEVMEAARANALTMYGI